MAMKEDDEEEYVISSAAVVRYQCMPSEVTLRQMRNRMQLAKLGKKLMKWTSLATSREMRSLGVELVAAYDELNEKLQDAYITLARSRYFNSNLNNVVTANVGKNAAVVVESRLRARSGVKVIQQEMKETNCNPYIYLGIEKGGEIIMEAKKQWHEIITMLILITQLRVTFLTVEKANKAANKKKNVFTRIIIPRTMETIAYIESGLEELAREDFFRLRRFINKKRSASPTYQERKPIEIKERLLPKESKRIFKIECFMCGAFLRFSLVNEREKFLERRKVEELRFQMNEMLIIAKKLEEHGIVDMNVNEFIVTAEKLKEKLNESPHIDQLCRTCKELLKRKQEKENEKKQELQQIEQNVQTQSNALNSELLTFSTGTPTDINETKVLAASTQDLNIKLIDKDDDSLSIKLKSLNGRTNEPEHSNLISESVTQIYRDTERDLTHFKENSIESTKKEISTITITKELKSDRSLYNQSLLDSPLETSVEKIKRVVTDDKENKSFVEEKFIITIKQKIKNVIGKITRSSQNSNSSIDENNNQNSHEMTTVIKIDSRLSSESIGIENRGTNVMSNSGLILDDKKFQKPPLIASNYQTVKVLSPSLSSISSENTIEQEAHKLNKNKNDSPFSSLSPKQETKKVLKDEISKKLTPPRSTSFTDVDIISNTVTNDEFKNDTIKKSTSSPLLYRSIDKPLERKAKAIDALDNSLRLTEPRSICPYAGVTIKEKVASEPRAEMTQLKDFDDHSLQKVQTSNDVEYDSRISAEPKSPENKENVHTTYTIQIKDNGSNKPSTSIATSKDQQKRVQISDARRSNSLPSVSRTSDTPPRGSISYGEISGAYIPPQNPTEILSEPCICVSSSTLLSTELDSNRD